MTLINNVLNRKPAHINARMDGMITWIDNLDTTVWYYSAVQETTNSRNWAFEKAYSTAASAGAWDTIYKKPD